MAVGFFKGASSSSTSSLMTGHDFFAIADGPELATGGDLDHFCFHPFFHVWCLPFALVCGIVFEGRAAASWGLISRMLVDK